MTNIGINIEETDAPNIQSIRTWTQKHRPQMVDDIHFMLHDDAYLLILTISFEAGRESWRVDQLDASMLVDYHGAVKTWCQANRKDLVRNMSIIMQDPEYFQVCKIGIEAGREFQRQRPTLPAGPGAYDPDVLAEHPAKV